MDATRIIAIRRRNRLERGQPASRGHLDIPLNGAGLWQARQAALARPMSPSTPSTQRPARAPGSRPAPSQKPHGRHDRPPIGYVNAALACCKGHTFAWKPRAGTSVPLAQARPRLSPPGRRSLIALPASASPPATHAWRPHVGGQIVLVAHGSVLDVLYRAATRQDIQARAPGNSAVRRHQPPALDAMASNSAWWDGPTHNTWTTPYAMKTTPTSSPPSSRPSGRPDRHPALVVDLDAMDRNIQHMAGFLPRHQVLAAPRQDAKAPSWPCCCSKPGHRACVQKSVRSRSPGRWRRAGHHHHQRSDCHAKLHRAALACTLPCQPGAAAWAWRWTARRHRARLAETMALSGSDTGMDVLVEIDVGQGRCGVPPGEDRRGAGTGRVAPRLRLRRPTTAAPSTCPARG